jgi:hypothetical protein
MNKENYVPIKGYEDYYLISDLGNVKSIKSNLLLKGGINRGGYLYVNLSKKGVTKNNRVHRLVAMHFIENPLNNNIVNHKDGNKKNNSVSNLEWVNSHENNSHFKKYLNKTSKYTGVSFDKSRGKFITSIMINGTHKHLGRFDNEIDAYNSYIDALNKYGVKNKYASDSSI